MSIIRNPRVGESFEFSNLKCSICDRINSYFILIEPYTLCKGCLTDCIQEIDNAIIEDIKNGK